MPIFEYKCEDCTFSFEEFVRSADDESEIICPQCKSTQVRRIFSVFGFSGFSEVGVSSPSSSGCSTCSSKNCSSCK